MPTETHGRGQRTVLGALHGHFWTLLPAVRHMLRPLPAPTCREWGTTTVDGNRTVRVVGRLRERSDTDTIVIVVHGLGGHVDSHYCVRIARAVDARGWSCLRLFLRGADGGGEDFYHAGLTTELSAALASAELARYRRALVIGYSLGGHVALHLACAPCHPRMAAVAAVCPPLDLTRGAAALDQPRFSLYRRHILSGLRFTYAGVAARASVPTPLERIRRVTRIREWDTLTVVPRYGFADADDYYRRASVGPRLRQLERPALIVHSRHDPLVPAWTVDSSLDDLPAPGEAWRLDVGGHVGFPHIEANGRGRLLLESHVLDWLDRKSRDTAQPPGLLG